MKAEFVLLLCFLGLGMSHTFSKQETLKHILKGYDKRVEPHHANVTFGLKFQCGNFCPRSNAFKAVVIEKYHWVDSRLQWDTKEHGDYHLHPRSNDIWTPDLKLYYTATPSVDYSHDELIVRSTGDVYWHPHAQYKVFCKHEEAKYHCHFRLGSFTHSTDSLTLTEGKFEVPAFEDEYCPFKATVKSHEIKTITPASCGKQFESIDVEVDYEKAH